ncbi:hypothetical protein D3C72_2402880 [compost metagenome]
MFLVDHHEIVAHIAEDLDGMARRGLDEGSEQRLARLEALAEGGKGLPGNCWHLDGLFL